VFLNEEPMPTNDDSLEAPIASENIRTVSIYGEGAGLDERKGRCEGCRRSGRVGGAWVFDLLASRVLMPCHKCPTT
jgi:hypothetical protein